MNSKSYPKIKTKFKCLYCQQGFWKVLPSWEFVKLSVNKWKKSLVSWVGCDVTSGSTICHCCFSNVEGLDRINGKIKAKMEGYCSRQARKIKIPSFETLLRRSWCYFTRHQSFITRSASFGVTEWETFKLDFVFCQNTFYVVEIPKSQNPVDHVNTWETIGHPSSSNGKYC